MTHPTKLSVQHGFAYKEPRQFAGWPANGGIWQWGDEILVRFQIGTYIDNSGGGHAIARDKPSRDILARSQDGIRAKFSEDNGKSWGDEICLRDDGRNWDFGYTRTIQRTDGKLATLYYYTTAENPEQHIAATIWTVNEN